MRAVGLQVTLAAPHRDNAVAVAMEEEHRTMINGRRAIDVELLRGDEILAPQLIQSPTTDIFRRVLWVEGGIEELATLTGFLEDRGWRLFALGNPIETPVQARSEVDK